MRIERKREREKERESERKSERCSCRGLFEAHRLVVVALVTVVGFNKV